MKSVSTLKFIPFITAALLAVASGNASALALSATADWSLNGGASVSDSATAPPGTVADILNSDTAGSNSVFYHVGGNDGGYYASRVSGNGVFDITGEWKSSIDFTNPLPVSANATYSLLIENGELTINLPTSLNGGSGLAEYELILSLNGSEFARSEAHLSMDSAGVVSLVKTGFDLGGTYDPSIASYSWGSTTTSFALGSIAAGASFTIGVDVITHATLDTLNDTCGSGGKPNGVADAVNGATIAGNGNSICGATARFGDPPGTTFDPNNPNNPGGGGTVTIPEPGSLSLLGLGLLAVAGMRRRVRR
jgi:hypothetical protein